MKPVVYLKKQLDFKATEWLSLSTEDKQWYKDEAAKEMILMGITPDLS